MKREYRDVSLWSRLLMGAIALVSACSSSNSDNKTSSPGDAGAESGFQAGPTQGRRAASGGSDAARTTLYLVGDSTVAAFNDPYYYPRYGYGTQIATYLNQTIAVDNLALSGRSSKSFIDPADNGNYAILTSSLKAATT